MFSSRAVARLRRTLKRRLARAGWLVARIRPEDQRYYSASFDDTVALPAGAEDVLTTTNPRLVRLRETYAALKLPVSIHSLWGVKNLSRDLDLKRFRGDNVYVWQYRQMRSGAAHLRMYLALEHVRSRDALGLLAKLEEDGLFGCWQFRYGSRPAVSRDLLDSVNEINFLDRNMGLGRQAGLRVLDIGAGYGRLAHRMAEALPNLEAYDCVDAVPESTHLCDYYLKFRRVDGKARAIPLDQLQQALGKSYHIAVNIHSFSECRQEAVRWWLRQVAEREIPWLLIVPNDREEMLSTEGGGVQNDFFPDIAAAGYDLAHKAPVYDHDELRELIGVHDYYFLFRRRQ